MEILLNISCPSATFLKRFFLLLSRGFGATLKSEVFAEPFKGKRPHPQQAGGDGREQRKSTGVDCLLVGLWRNVFFLGSRGVLEKRPKPSFFSRGPPQNYLSQQQMADPGTAAVNKRGYSVDKREYSVDRLLVIFPSCLRGRLLLALSARFPLLSAGLLLPSRLRP